MMELVKPTKESLIGRAKHIRAEIQQIFDDVAHWNSMHPIHEHVDADPGGDLKLRMEEIDKFLGAGA